MKDFTIFFSVFLITLACMALACHPTFKREQAERLLKTRYSNVELQDYYSYPNCSTAHTFATAWRAQDEKGRPVSGVLCCDSRFDCLVFEQVSVQLSF